MAFLLPFAPLLVGSAVCAVQEFFDAPRKQARAHERVQEEKRNADAQIRAKADQAMAEAEANKQAALQKIQQERNQLHLMREILDACQKGSRKTLKKITHLDNAHFKSLGTRPLAVSVDETFRASIYNLLETEKQRRRMF